MIKQVALIGDLFYLDSLHRGILILTGFSVAMADISQRCFNPLHRGILILTDILSMHFRKGWTLVSIPCIGAF